MSEQQQDEQEAVLTQLKNGIIRGLAAWVVTAIIAVVIFYFSMLNFKVQQEDKNVQLQEQIKSMQDDLKTKVSQKDLENYTSAIKVQLNSISSSVENNNRQQDNMFNYILNKPGR